MDRNGLAQLIAMRGNQPPGPLLGPPNSMSYIPPDWRQEGPPGFVPPQFDPAQVAADALAAGMGEPLGREHGVMGPPGPPMGFPLEGRTRFPDDLTRTMESDRLSKMARRMPQTGQIPGGPNYLDQNRSAPGERERLAPRQYGLGQMI